MEPRFIIMFNFCHLISVGHAWNNPSLMQEQSVWRRMCASLYSRSIVSYIYSVIVSTSFFCLYGQSKPIKSICIVSFIIRCRISLPNFEFIYHIALFNNNKLFETHFNLVWYFTFTSLVGQVMWRWFFKVSILHYIVLRLTAA